MPITLTDEELGRVANLLTPNPFCYVVHRENGIGDPERCNGFMTIIDGKVFFEKTCGEPCTYVCKTSRVFADNVHIINRIVEAINAVKL